MNTNILYIHKQLSSGFFWLYFYHRKNFVYSKQIVVDVTRLSMVLWNLNVQRYGEKKWHISVPSTLQW